MSFIRTGLREIGLKVRRQRTRLALRHEKRLLQKSEINLGREGTSQAGNFPELRNEIVALKKLEQEQKEVALRIAQIEEGIKKIAAEGQKNSQAQTEAMTKQEAEKKPILQRRNEAKSAADVCDRELAGVERRIQDNDAMDREILKELSSLQAAEAPPPDLDVKRAGLSARRTRLPEQRAELVRARMGSADACRLAKEKLLAADAELSAIDKNIDRRCASTRPGTGMSATGTSCTSASSRRAAPARCSSRRPRWRSAGASPDCRGAKKSRLLEHWPPSCLPGNCTPQRAAAFN